MNKHMRRVQGAFLLGGLLLFGYLVYRVGVDKLLSHVMMVGWGIVPFVMLHGVKEAFSTSAWYFTLRDERARFGWGSLYLINHVGAAVNKVIPSATVGGEAVKVMFLRERLRTSDGMASVIISKLAQAVGQILFILSGLFLVFNRLDLPSGWRLTSIGALSALAVLLVVFLMLQRKGLVGSMVRMFEAVGIRLSAFGALKERASTMDRTISRFHSREKGRFLLSILLQAMRQFVDIAQVYLVLRLLGLQPSLVTCFIFSVASVLVNTLLFFIPGRVGVQEGGKVLVAVALGYSSAQGLTLGIISRLNQIIWTLVGLMIFLGLHLSKRKAGVAVG